MIREFDVETPDGRTLHSYDTGPTADPGAELVVVWHHGTPNLGTPPRPLFAEAARLGIRFVAYDRPGYGTSTPVPDRATGSAAADTAALADALGLARFALMGHSGGAVHALAAAAGLPDRVLAVAAVSGLAPLSGWPADGPDWFAGMAPGSAAGLRAAAAGRAEKEAWEATAEFDPQMFTAADYASLDGVWSWFMEVVEPAQAAGPAPLIDDDLALVRPWGVDLGAIAAPTLLLNGADDRIAPAAHAARLAELIPGAELRLQAGDGHISVLDTGGVAALEWLRAAA